MGRDVRRSVRAALRAARIETRQEEETRNRLVANQARAAARLRVQGQHATETHAGTTHDELHHHRALVQVERSTPHR